MRRKYFIIFGIIFLLLALNYHNAIEHNAFYCDFYGHSEFPSIGFSKCVKAEIYAVLRPLPLALGIILIGFGIFKNETKKK